MDTRGLSIIEYINFLQRYIIVHSYIYYEMNDNIVSDREYDLKARELVSLKNEYPELWRNSLYFKQFGDDYTGDTGFTLYHDLDERQKKIIHCIVNCIFRQERM